MILLISVYQVARITGMTHWNPAAVFSLNRKYDPTKSLQNENAASVYRNKATTSFAV
jgi:hypothetical protein